jgi:hypothetical protein
VDSRTLVMQTCTVLDMSSIPSVPYLNSFKNTEKHVLVSIVSFLAVRSVEACSTPSALVQSALLLGIQMQLFQAS